MEFMGLVMPGLRSKMITTLNHALIQCSISSFVISAQLTCDHGFNKGKPCDKNGFVPRANLIGSLHSCNAEGDLTLSFISRF